MSTQSRILEEIILERFKQDHKWGVQDHSPAVYTSILMEEVGEVAKAVLEETFGGGEQEIREELIQVAAVAIAFIECLDRGKWKLPKE